jgi:hypothetical protein
MLPKSEIILCFLISFAVSMLAEDPRRSTSVTGFTYTLSDKYIDERFHTVD